MSYSIRIGFLLAILSVIVGAGIYQGFQIQPKTIIISQKKLHAIISPQTQRFVAPAWIGNLDHSSFVKQFTQEPFQINEANTLWPNNVQPEVIFFNITGKKILPLLPTYNLLIPALSYIQPFSTLFKQGLAALWPHNTSVSSSSVEPQNFQPILKYTPSFGLESKMLWPNNHHSIFIFSTTPVRALVSPVESQDLAKPALKFTPSFPDFKIQESKGLFPHRYLHVIRPIVIEQISPPSHTQSFNLATFLSGYTQLFDLLRQEISQKNNVHPKNIGITEQKVPSPVVSLQTPLPVSPISIQSAALMGDVGHTQLILRLSEKPFYIVRTDNAHKTITLMIDNINPDISSIPPLDTQGTAIQNITFNVTPNNQFLVTLTLFPQTDVQGLRYKGNDLVIDVGLGAQIPYVQSQNTTSTPSGPVQPLVKVPVPLSPNELATENYNEAVDLLNQGNTQGAMGLLEMVVTQHPDYLDGRVLLSNLLLQQNNAQESLNVLMGAIPQPIFQDNEVYYNLLAEAYRQSGDFRSAVKIYRQLLSMNSSNGSWWVGLGMCFEGLGQMSASTEAYQKAQSTGSLSPLLQTFVSKKLGSSE